MLCKKSLHGMGFYSHVRKKCLLRWNFEIPKEFYNIELT